MPLAPSQWRQMLADAQRLSPKLQEADSTDRQEDARSRPDSSAESSGSSDVSGATAVAPRPDVVVLDVRNDYEWDAGHFQGAKRPQEVCHHVFDHQYYRTSRLPASVTHSLLNLFMVMLSMPCKVWGMGQHGVTAQDVAAYWLCNPSAAQCFCGTVHCTGLVWSNALQASSCHSHLFAQFSTDSSG